MYIRTSLFVSFKTTFSNGLLTNNSTWCQNKGCICISSARRTYGRIHMLPAYIQSSRQVQQFCKQNYFQRRGERRSKERYFSLLRVQCFHTESIHSTRNPASFQSSRAKTTILHTELILLQEISKKYYNYKAHPMHTDRRHPPTSVPRTSKHSTRQNKAPGSPTAFQAHTAQAGFQLILPSRNSILSGSQHPCSPYSSSQANSTRIHLVLQNSTRRNRIHYKRVKYCISMQY